MKRRQSIFVATIVAATGTAACGGSGDNTTSAATSSASSSATGASSTSSGVGGATTSSSSSGASTSSASSSSSSGTGTGGAGGFMTAAHAPWPLLVKTGTGEIATPRVVLLIPQNMSASLAQNLTDFANAVPTSSWFSTWSADAPEIGVAQATVTMPGGALASGTMLAPADVTAYVDAAIATANDPSLAPNGHNIYLVVFPKGVYAQGHPLGPGVFGRHGVYGASGDAWAFVQQPQNGGQFGAVTSVASHEIAEAATDTGPGYRVSAAGGMSPWMFSSWASWEGNGPKAGHVENGDLCEGSRITEGTLNYQRIYTNKAALLGGDPCEPALPLPYFNVSPALDWTQGAAGQDVTVDLTAWSTGPTGDFWVRVEGAAQSDANDVYALSVVTPRTAMLNGMAAPVLNNGEHGTLHVTIPAAAQSGAWAVLSLRTWHADAKNMAIPGEDRSHLMSVGVYVP